MGTHVPSLQHSPAGHSGCAVVAFHGPSRDLGSLSMEAALSSQHYQVRLTRRFRQLGRLTPQALERMSQTLPIPGSLKDTTRVGGWWPVPGSPVKAEGNRRRNLPGG